MATVVQKFGGSSLADLVQLARVAELVAATRRAGSDLVVVVSAMGKTTEALLELGRQAGTIASASPDAPRRDPPRRELDMLLSSGERVSMALLSIALQARGTSAVSLTGSQAGILTCDRHFDAEVLEIQPRRIQEQLARGQVVIVAGYQGMSRAREITTLGRGGSDTTAVALAAALGAERCEIYSDVDGIYSADPRNVRGARHLSSIDYPTLQAMAEAGAKVVNARAVAWGARHGVAIHARATADFASGRGGRETRVVSQPEASARAVVTCPQVALLSAAVSARDALAAAIAEAGLPLRDLRLLPDRAVATVPLTSVPDFGRARVYLERQHLPGLHIDERCAELCALGDDAQAHSERLLAALAGTPRFALSELRRVTALVTPEAAPAAEREWHRLFVEAA
jgi:aspartate kinase